MDPLPSSTLSPLASRIDAVLAVYGYEMAAAIDAIDSAVPGFGGLFDPGTTDGEIRAAVDKILAGDTPSVSERDADPTVTDIVLYVDGSSRGNPGPSGAGAVLQVGGESIAELGRPVGSRAENNTAEYAALHLGLEALVSRYGAATIEVRIDSMTVINDIWRDGDGVPAATPYRPGIKNCLAALSACEWTHLADHEPNPADARATVGADIAALGPGA